jgi:hypothetical protein
MTETKSNLTDESGRNIKPVLATVPCPECNGYGWFADHSMEHCHNSHDPDCTKYGCPVQVQCEKCNGKGYCC